jgi:hypothetical protein
MAQTKLPEADFNSNDQAHFAFLEDDDAAGAVGGPPGDWFAPPVRGAGPLSPRPIPVNPANGWQALDADYRVLPEPPTALSLAELLRRDAPPVAVYQRARLEPPVLLGWVAVSSLWLGALPWLVLGLGMIGFSLFMRRTFALCSMAGYAGVYRALGGGQMLLGVVAVTGPGPFAPLLGLYAGCVLLAWVFVECRYMVRVERQNLRDQPAPLMF